MKNVYLPGCCYLPVADHHRMKEAAAAGFERVISRIVSPGKKIEK